jgi:primosomal protein N' (replication factor Y)
MHHVSVALATPAHSAVGGLLTYSSESSLTPGTLVRVSLGKTDKLGVVWASTDQPPIDLSPDQIKPIAAVLHQLPPLSAHWRQLIEFAARYYQRSVGEVAMAALPPQLRGFDPEQLQRRLKRRAALPVTHDETIAPVAPELSAAQAQVLTQWTGNKPALLFGVTGSGKTEVYLQAVAALLAEQPAAQALVLVPEINLTPQLIERFEARFCASHGAQAVVALHSGLSPAQRTKNWLLAHSGQARIVLGTRLGVFASAPNLQLIVVDEEHDPSYKAQDGARYSARDLAIYRAHHEGIRVLLGSATPSLESWQAAQSGRYQLLAMPERIGAAPLPAVKLVDMRAQPKGTLFAAPLLAEIQARAQRGEQTLVLLNRRGYAPVLHCAACSWKSDCAHCSATQVFHKIDRTLRCHHCGVTHRVPRACPSCGNPDIGTQGRGTEQLEEQLIALLADIRRADGEPLKVARMDADTTKLKGSLEAQLAAIHSGAVDVLVGTQMVAKGHDFRRIGLVAAVNVDAGLFSGDFRAGERLFALLMQVAGRAGRDATLTREPQLWIQTYSPEHPLFAALKKHDFPGFATRELAEREAAQMPPFAYQALIRAEARTQDIAQGFLNDCALAATGCEAHAAVQVFPPVPMSMARVANVERAQMLIESASRAGLQKFLADFQNVLHNQRPRGLIRWAMDVDPLAI